MTKKNINNLSEFYHGNGKADPAQFDNRLLKDNEYFWSSVKSERDRLKDFGVVKRREVELLSRMKRITDRKKLPDEREDMCDEKFFRRLGEM